jgi:hypothetical protein
MAPDGKSIYGTSNLTTSTLNDVFKIPLANAWDFSSINISGIVCANILTPPSSGGLLSSVNNRYGLTMSDDGKSITLYGVRAGSTRLFSVPLDIPYDILSTNTQVILRSLIPGVDPGGYNQQNAPVQTLGKGGVTRFSRTMSFTDPEGPDSFATYRGFSNFPYGANGFPSTSYVPATRNWNDFSYGGGSGAVVAPYLDNLFFSDDGRYAVTNPDATLNTITIVKLNTPFDPLTAEIYDQIEFANTSSIFLPTTAMKAFPADYRVMYYDQENDKIILYRRRYVYGINQQVTSIVEIS